MVVKLKENYTKTGIKWRVPVNIAPSLLRIWNGSASYDHNVLHNYVGLHFKKYNKNKIMYVTSRIYRQYS